MKIGKIICFALCIAASVSFSGCLGCNINDRSNTAYYLPQDDGEYYVYNIKPYTYSDYVLKIDKVSGEAFLKESGTDELYGETSAVVLSGNDFPNYTTFYAEGYESLPELLTEKYESGGVKQIQYYAVEYEDSIAYGFCNMYSSAAGFLSGGGNISAGKIVGSALYSYNPLSDEFEEIRYFEKCNIVAFNTHSVIYFKNEQYYAFNCYTGEETFICRDEAYDTGITDYSRVCFLFNEDICVILMTVGSNNYEQDYQKIVVCDYEGVCLLTQSWNTWDYLTRSAE